MPDLELWASPEPTVARIDEDTMRDQIAETGLDRACRSTTPSGSPRSA